MVEFHFRAQDPARLQQFAYDTAAHGGTSGVRMLGGARAWGYQILPDANASAQETTEFLANCSWRHASNRRTLDGA
jgi:hypothetical protein